MLFALLLGHCIAFILPGARPQKYSLNSPISLSLISIDSFPLQNHIEINSLSYFHPFIAEFSNHSIYMQKPEPCQDLFTLTYTPNQLAEIMVFIDNNYTLSWFLDDLPSGLRVVVPKLYTKFSSYSANPPLGIQVKDFYYIFNHYHIIVKVFKVSNDEWHVVGFLIEPYSLKSSNGTTCQVYDFKRIFSIQEEFRERFLGDEAVDVLEEMLEESLEKQELIGEIKVSYSITFEESKKQWTSRWDLYLHKNKGQVQWISITNTFGLVIFFSLILTRIFNQTINQDLVINDDSYDSSIKQLSGDIFRPPRMTPILCLVLSLGIQCIMILTILIFLTYLSFLYSEYCEEILLLMLLLIILGNLAGGIVSGASCKMLYVAEWRIVGVLNGILLPELYFSISILIKSVGFIQNFEGILDYVEMVSVLILWFCFSVPLSCIGAFFGYRNAKPVVFNKVPRPIGDVDRRGWGLVFFVGGFLPFACIFMQIRYIVQSVWDHSFVALFFVFVFLSLALVVVVSAQVGILLAYMVMKKYEYRWWWISFFVPASSSGYFLLYFTYYSYYHICAPTLTTIATYFGYLFLSTIVFALITGTSGVLGTFFFLQKIFSLIKSE